MADSLVEHDRLDLAREIMRRAGKLGTDILLPVDLVVTDDLGNPTTIETVSADQIPAAGKAVDIGPASRESIGLVVADAGAIFWNGPLGVFERPPFDKGTVSVAAAIGTSPGQSVIGGGETVAAASRAGVLDKLNHVSTGGGASLELLAGKVLPGVAALEVKE